MTKKIYSIFVFVLLSFSLLPGEERAFPVDISFPTIDLKYSKEKGVQILEFNTGIRSHYKGSGKLNDDPYQVAKKFVEILALYHNQVWYYPDDVASSLFKKVFSQSPYYVLPHEDTAFEKAAKAPVYDPQKIQNYHGVYLGNITSLQKLDAFRKDYPGIIPLSAALIKFRAAKGKLNDFFSSCESLSRFKPAFGHYKKVYSPNLAKTILKEIGSKILVIKPLTSTGGKGIIIVHRDDLDATLKYILSDSACLRKDRDISYRWWVQDKSLEFVVEEFVASDTVFLKNKPYDGTMRVVVLLTYNDGEIAIHFLDKYWKLPRLSLDRKGSLNGKHKSAASKGDFLKVENKVWKEVESQLREALTTLYDKCL